MSLLGSSDLKEQQKINDLELKINIEKQKLDKKLTRQKILLGSFMIDLLETDKVEGLTNYTANNLNNFLTREGDQELLSGLISSLKKKIHNFEDVKNHGNENDSQE